MPAIANNSNGLAPIPAFLGSENNARKHVMLVSLLVVSYNLKEICGKGKFEENI